MMQNTTGVNTRGKLTPLNHIDTQSIELTLQDLKSLESDRISPVIARYSLKILAAQCGVQSIRSVHSKLLHAYMSHLESSIEGNNEGKEVNSDLRGKKGSRSRFDGYGGSDLGE